MKQNIKSLINLNRWYIGLIYASVVTGIIAGIVLGVTVSNTNQQVGYNDATVIIIPICAIFLSPLNPVNWALLVLSIIKVIKMQEADEALGKTYTSLFVFSIISIFCSFFPLYLLGLIISYLMNGKYKEYLHQLEIKEQAAQGSSGINMPQGGIPTNGTRQQPIDYEFYNK